MQKEKNYNWGDFFHDNVLIGVTVWSVSRTLQIIFPSRYDQLWTPWMWGIIALWAVSQVVFAKRLIQTKSRRDSITPLGTEELAAFARYGRSNRN